MFSKYMVVSVVYGGLFIFIFDARLDELRLLRFGGHSLRVFVRLLQMPRHKDILSRKLFVLLLIRPDQHQHTASWFQNAVHFSERLGPQRVGREVVNHRYRN
jgi:hypothetical protein